MAYDVSFKKDKNEYFFTVTTKLGSYSHKIQFISMIWVQRHLQKLGLEPQATIRHIVNAYLIWFNKETQQK